MNAKKKPDIVIGGGLGGLCAAILLARAGHEVLLFEKASTLGGRAATHEESGARFNLGPHALYRAGVGRKTLRELGVEPAGQVPPSSGMLALARGRLHALPVGLASMLGTSLLGLGEKLESARQLQRLEKLEPDGLRGQTVREWVNQAVQRPTSRQLFHALVRVSTYANAPDHMNAGAALRQLQLALGANVMYVDGGWQTMIDALHAAAIEAGVQVSVSRRVASVEPGRVRLADGTDIDAGAVIIAASPSAARALVPTSPTLAGYERDAVPLRAACLDLALSSLPRPRAIFCLGIDEPLYYSVHSATARLAPEPIQVIHVARYLAPGEEADASSLEALVDRLQPGWRELVVARRFMPELVVAHDVFPVGRSRATAALPDAPGVWIAGDWVGDGAMLSDASIASARAAVSGILDNGTIDDTSAHDRRHRLQVA